MLYVYFAYKQTKAPSALNILLYDVKADKLGDGRSSLGFWI